jgi:hypothetical protein
MRVPYKSFYSNKDSRVAAQRLFRHHFRINGNNPVPSAIKMWIKNPEK